MDRVTVTFFGIVAVFVTLVQTLHALSEDEYNRREAKIKSDPAVQKFLQDQHFEFSQYGILFDKLTETFAHIARTKEGSDTLQTAWNEIDKILGQEKTFDMAKNIFSAIAKVTTSDIGSRNVLAVADFVQTLLATPKLFDMFCEQMKILLDVLLSADGLNAIVMIKQHYNDVNESPMYGSIMKIVDTELPLFLPVETKYSNEANDKISKASRLKMLLDRFTVRSR